MSRVRKLGRIGKRGRPNPSRSIRSTRRKAGSKETPWQFSGRYRFSENRYPRDMAGTLGYYHVQVRRRNRWLTLATFPRDSLTGKLGMARATEYGKLLARRYPRQKFRVFWPDGQRKNPLARSVDVEAAAPDTIKDARLDGYYVVMWRWPLEKTWSFAAMGKSLQEAKTKERSFHYQNKNAETAILRPLRKKNPAPRARGVNGAEVDRAARLFQSFTGHRVTRARQVNLPRPKVGLAIGPVLGISYATTRDGKRENYQHDFRLGARPLLAVSQDGRTLMLLGGGHRFTPRGIVDRR